MRDGVAALEPGQHLGGRVPAVQRVGPVGADEQHRTAARLGEPFEERDALGVGPVQVVEHDHTRRSRGEIADDIEPESQALVRGPVGIREEREALVVARLAGCEGVEQELERAPERAGIRLARVHDRAVREPVDQLADEAGLAHSRFAADQCHRRGLARPHQAGEPVELVGATDHLG